MSFYSLERPSLSMLGEAGQAIDTIFAKQASVQFFATSKQAGTAMAILIDGYNLLHAAGVFPARHLPGTLQHARTALLEELVSLLPERDLAQTIIVFDAAEAPPGLPDTMRFHGLDVRFARNHADADEMIELLIDECLAPRELVVVSSDHRLHRAARRRRATPIDCDVWFKGLAALQQVWQEERATAKPQEPLSESEVNFWLKKFATPAEPEANSAESSPSNASETPRPNQAEPPPEEWPETGTYNPFPPGYADDLFDEESQ